MAHVYCRDCYEYLFQIVLLIKKTTGRRHDFFLSKQWLMSHWNAILCFGYHDITSLTSLTSLKFCKGRSWIAVLYSHFRSELCPFRTGFHRIQCSSDLASHWKATFCLELKQAVIAGVCSPFTGFEPRMTPSNMKQDMMSTVQKPFVYALEALFQKLTVDYLEHNSGAGTYASPHQSAGLDPD